MLNVFLRRRLRAVLPDGCLGSRKASAAVSGRLRPYGSAKVQISWQLFSPAELAVAFIEPPAPHAIRP